MTGRERERELDEKCKKVITVLSKAPLDPEELGKPVSGAPPRRVEPRVEDAVDEDAMEVDRGADDRGDDARDRPEGPMLGPHAVEVEGPEQEALVINGTRLTETSPLRELRMACVWMGISKNGSKAAVWSRLKREVAFAKLKVSVEASEAVKAEYSREPLVPSLAERPSEDLVLLHETTHIPRAPWCEACLASRSREDNYSDALPTREYPILSIDYMFTSTEGEGQPLATHLIIVDSQTKYTQAIAIDGKGARSLKHCVEEIVRMANTLGYTRIGLRYDTEPAMKQLAAYVVATRLKAGLATEEEPVAPDPENHGASQAERYIGIVRSLGNCLLQTIEQRTGHKTVSSDPLFAWCYRHAAFLHTRFKVQKDGCTSFEIVHGRKYKSKLMPFGSFVYAQLLPESKSKGDSWKACVWLGRSTVGDLNLVADAQGVHQARSVRLSPKRFDVEALKTMKGVPVAVRLPTIAEGPGPDEAASDPPSTPAGAGAGASNIGSDADMSLPGESRSSSASGMSSDQSSELRADGGVPGVNRVELEAEMPTGHDDREGFSEADGDPLEAGLEVDWRVEECEDEAQPDVQLDYDFSKEWSDWKYEDGPPHLPEDKMELLDAAMDKVELSRLVKMGVLKRLSENDDVSGMMNLQSKFVRDWRFRANEAGTKWTWVRRSRLVAKEFRFIDPTMEHLYAPASLSCLQKLFASLACACPKLRIYTGDIKDAYLTVPQRRPTFIRLGDLCFQLLYNLPGQRAGARDFYDKLAKVMRDDEMESFKAAPALFIEAKTIAVSTHVDDFEILSTDERVERLKNKLKGAGLNFSLEGPCTVEGGECHFLKRKFTGTGEGILVSQSGKHIQKLVELVGVQRAAGKQTPCPLNPNDVKDETPLDEARHAIYRTAVGVLLYLGQDRPECLYAIKVLSGKCTCPTEHEWSLLRHLVKFLKAHPDQGILLTPCTPGRTVQQRCLGLDAKSKPKDCLFGSGHLIEAISDASWAGERDRKSISAMCIYVNGNLVHACNRRQKCITLSSCEAELHGSLAAVQEGIFLKRVIEHLCGEPVQLVHRVDSSSCRAVIGREGLTRMRHIDISYLWIQERCRSGEFSTSAVSTKFCPPDLLTKSMNQQRMRMLSFMLGIVRDGEYVGKAEFEDEIAKHELKRVKTCRVKHHTQSLRQLLLVVLATLGESASVGSTCSGLFAHGHSTIAAKLFPLVLAVIMLTLMLVILYALVVHPIQAHLSHSSESQGSMSKHSIQMMKKPIEANPRSEDMLATNPEFQHDQRSSWERFSRNNMHSSSKTRKATEEPHTTKDGPPNGSWNMNAVFTVSWSDEALFKVWLWTVMLLIFFGAIWQIGIWLGWRIIGRVFWRHHRESDQGQVEGGQRREHQHHRGHHRGLHHQEDDCGPHHRGEEELHYGEGEPRLHYQRDQQHQELRRDLPHQGHQRDLRQPGPQRDLREPGPQRDVRQPGLQQDLPHREHQRDLHRDRGERDVHRHGDERRGPGDQDCGGHGGPHDPPNSGLDENDLRVYRARRACDLGYSDQQVRVASRFGYAFHVASCSSIAKDAKVVTTMSIMNALMDGYEPCQKCLKPVAGAIKDYATIRRRRNRHR